MSRKLENARPERPAEDLMKADHEDLAEYAAELEVALDQALDEIRRRDIDRFEDIVIELGELKKLEIHFMRTSELGGFRSYPSITYRKAKLAMEAEELHNRARMNVNFDDLMSVILGKAFSFMDLKNMLKRFPSEDEWQCDLLDLSNQASKREKIKRVRKKKPAKKIKAG